MSKYKMTNLGSSVIKKGTAQGVLPKIMRESLLLDSAIELGDNSDLLIVGIRQNNTNYYTVGSVNKDDKAGSISFRNGKDNKKLSDINNIELPYLTNASELLLANYKEMSGHLYCDRIIANEIQNNSIDEVNGYLNFCEKCGLIEPSKIKSPTDDDIITIESLEDYAKTSSLFNFGNEVVVAGDILGELNSSISQIENSKSLESAQIQQELQQQREAENAPEAMSPTAPL